MTAMNLTSSFTSTLLLSDALTETVKLGLHRLACLSMMNVHKATGQVRSLLFREVSLPHGL